MALVILQLKNGVTDISPITASESVVVNISDWESDWDNIKCSISSNGAILTTLDKVVEFLYKRLPQVLKNTMDENEIKLYVHSLFGNSDTVSVINTDGVLRFNAVASAIEYKVVQDLPNNLTENDKNTLFLVKSLDIPGDEYAEYAVIKSLDSYKLEKIGSVSLDLSDYANSDNIIDILAKNLTPKQSDQKQYADNINSRKVMLNAIFNGAGLDGITADNPFSLEYRLSYTIPENLYQ